MGTISYAQANEDLTVYTIKKDYVKAKYEPDEGIYLGAYVLQDKKIDYSMSNFNAITGKKHASFFKYVGYGRPFPTEWVNQCKAVGAIPHIAWEPNNGLDQVKDDEYLRNFAREANKANVPIFLRFASEMNGTWTEYSGNPSLYIKKWRLVHDVMEQEAPKVIMVWTVFTFPDNTIESFYPGDGYVDWVGVNIYNVVYHNNSLRERADHEDPLKLLDFVYNTYSYKKPIQISEYGATHYTITDDAYHVDFARRKIQRMYENIPRKYPRVKSIFYFDVNNLSNALPGRKINDYSITNDPTILKCYSDCIQQPDYLSDIKEDNGNHVDKELLSYRGYVFCQNGKSYADIDFFKNYLSLKVISYKNGKLTLSNGKVQATFSVKYKNIYKGYYNSWKRVRGISIREVANAFGYMIKYDPKNNSVFVYAE